MSVHWKTIDTNNNKCTGCGKDMPQDSLALHIGRIKGGWGKFQNCHICEDCFNSAQIDYEEGE